MPSQKKYRWTLRRQLQFIIIGATVFMLLFAGISIWRIQQFNHRDKELHQTVTNLQNNLRSNFANTRLLGEIDTNLRLYLRSGNSEAISNILVALHSLKYTLDQKDQDKLQEFEEKLRILQIRMNSLRENDTNVFQTERRIVHATSRLLHAAGVAFYFPIQNLSTEACLEHHHLYNTIIQTTESGNLQRATREYDELFEGIEKKIGELSLQLKPEIRTYADDLQQSFYELDETISTINSIRAVTLATKSDIEQRIVSLKSNIAVGTIAKAQASSSSLDTVMTTARNNLIIMTISLVAVAFLLVFIAMFFNQVMVKPLLAFSDMLQKMTRMLTGLRKQSEFESEFSGILSSLTNGRKDEIGQVASAIENLLVKLRSLAVFRQAVEADETSNEIYQRLARTFQENLGLQHFVIFELMDKGSEMVAVLNHLEEYKEELPQLSINMECRARRTGTMISSLSDANTCALFSKGDRLRHVCIPMEVSGQIIGVTQFIFPPYMNKEENQKALQALTEARHFIAEALPVLHAKRLANRLKIMATEDQLTGLYNRHHLENTIDRLVAGIKRRNSRICILMCDLDHFKDVNDTYGHDAGDNVLVQLAKILLNTVRDADMVIRFGGEEFMILLTDCDPGTSTDMAERIRLKVQQQKFSIPGHTIRMTLSIGFVDFPRTPNQEIWDAFKLADIALYRAKEKGRNCIVQFNDSLLTQPTSATVENEPS